VKTIYTIGIYICLIFLCSCATEQKSPENVSPLLPAETSFNKNAGWGNPNDWLYLTLHLENGKNLLFFVDTGASGTVLDKSLEPQLGKRLGKIKGNYLWSGKSTLNEFAAPKLFLGDIPLAMGDRIFTDDLSQWPSDEPLMGILGIDCLQHYCIQLDFDAKKMCFLNPDNLETNNLGKAFPLKISSGWVFVRANLFGQKNARFSVDSGCTLDGTLISKLFQAELKKQKPISIDESKTGTGAPEHTAIFQAMLFENEVNGDVILSDCPENLLGLRFLSRNLVTLNFPKRIMYLQPRSQKSLMEENKSMKPQSE
jgi:hypothetical protein